MECTVLEGPVYDSCIISYLYKHVKYTRMGTAAA